MCLDIPGQIIAVTGGAQDMATVSISGAQRQVSIALIGADDVAPGDWVMVHAGFALCKIDEQEARETLQALQDIGDAFAAEMAIVSTVGEVT